MKDYSFTIGGLTVFSEGTKRVRKCLDAFRRSMGERPAAILVGRDFMTALSKHQDYSMMSTWMNLPSREFRNVYGYKLIIVPYMKGVLAIGREVAEAISNQG